MNYTTRDLATQLNAQFAEVADNGDLTPEQAAIPGLLLGEDSCDTVFLFRDGKMLVQCEFAGDFIVGYASVNAPASIVGTDARYAHTRAIAELAIALAGFRIRQMIDFDAHVAILIEAPTAAVEEAAQALQRLADNRALLNTLGDA